MPERIRIDTIDHLPPGSGKTYTVGERAIAVFNVAGDLYAIDDRCPHRGASLGRGTLHEAVVNCPLHGWAFDLRSGQCVDRSGYGLERFEVFLQDENIILDVTPPATESRDDADEIYRYLVRYGAMGWVGRFGSVERIDCGYRDRVLVHTGRGLEIGVVLAAPGENGLDRHKPAGEVLRRLTEQDEARAQGAGGVPETLIEDCRRRLQERQLSLEIIDAERLFDGETIVLYYLGDPPAEIDELAAELGQSTEARVLMQPALEPLMPAGGGCGDCGCSRE